MTGGDGWAIDRLMPDGTWSLVGPSGPTTLAGRVVAPWAPFNKRAQVPADAAPGTYRLRDGVHRRDPGSLPEALPLTAQFEVTA